MLDDNVVVVVVTAAEEDEAPSDVALEELPSLEEEVLSDELDVAVASVIAAKDSAESAPPRKQAELPSASTSIAVEDKNLP